MGLHFHAFLLTLLAVLVASHSTEAKVGGKLYTVPNLITESRVIYLGKFAVNEHNKVADTKLQFQGVAEAKQRNGVFENAEGIYYDLSILAGTTIEDPDWYLWKKPSSVQPVLTDVHKYEAGVFDKQFGPNYLTKLLSFNVEGSSPRPVSLAPRKQ